MAKLIAIDFDGCLVENKYPDIGEPIQATLDAYAKEKENGTEFILWTCRKDEQLDEALAWCDEHGIEFVAVNDNTQEAKEAYGGDSRKIWCTEYWDDKAVKMPPEDNTEMKVMSMGAEMFRLCHRARMSADVPDEGDVELYGEIIDDYGKWYKDVYPNDKCAVDFKRDIESIKAKGAKKLRMRINSPGGVVSQAVAMRSILGDAGFDEVNIIIEGMCASAATLIATVPGANVQITEGSQYMIHRPIAGMYGTAADMESCARSLRNIEDSAVDMYVRRTGQAEDTVREWMNAETWFSASDAVKYGFADTVKTNTATAELPAVACVSGATMAAMRAIYHAIPSAIIVSPGESSTPTEIDDRRDNDTMDMKDLTVEKLAQYNPALVDEIRQSAVNAERERVAEIEAMTLPGYEEMADKAKQDGLSAIEFHKQMAAAMRQRGREFIEARKKETEPAQQVAGQSASDIVVDEDKMIADNAKEIAGYAQQITRADSGMY